MYRESLSKVGYRPDTIRNPSYLKDNLSSYELHVIRDHVVSIPYYFHKDIDGTIYSLYEGEKIPLSLDKRERSGFYKTGISAAFDLATQSKNIGQLVCLYSPPGPASFEDEPPDDYDKPYRIGQLYLLWNDGSKITNLAVSLNNEGEQWLPEIFGEQYFSDLGQEENGIGKIIYQITHPFLSNLTIYDFLRKTCDYKGEIYRSKSYLGEKSYDVNMTLLEIEKSLRGQLKGEFDHSAIAYKMAQSGRSSFDGYSFMTAGIMMQTGLSKIPLGGNCGGEEVSFSESVSDLIKQERSMFSAPNFSSDYRNPLQRDDEDYRNDPNLCRCGNREPHFHCPGKTDKGPCLTPIVVGRGITKCPHCGLDATCN